MALAILRLYTSQTFCLSASFSKGCWPEVSKCPSAHSRMRKPMVYKNGLQGRSRGGAQERELGLDSSRHSDTQVYLFIVVSFVICKKTRSFQL